MDNNFTLLETNLEEATNADLKGNASVNQTEQLHSDLNEWYAVLVAFKRDTELQLIAQKTRVAKKKIHFQSKADKAGWLEFKEQEDLRRIKSIRFIASVEQRIAYVRGLKRAASTKYTNH